MTTISKKKFVFAPVLFLTVLLIKFSFSGDNNNNISAPPTPPPPPAFKLIPLRLVYLMFTENDEMVHGGGMYPLRDILVERVNSPNSTLLRSYNVTVDMYNTNYHIERNVAKSIRLFTQHLANDCSYDDDDSELTASGGGGAGESLRTIVDAHMRKLLTKCYSANTNTSNSYLSDCFIRNFSKSDVFANAAAYLSSSSSSSSLLLLRRRRRYTAPLFFGPEYSAEARIVAQLAPLYNLVEICAATVATDLSNRELYPNFFRTVATSEIFVKVPRALALYFNFTAVALLERDEPYTEPMRRMDYDLTAHNITVLFHNKFRMSALNNDSIDQVLNSIVLYDARILFIWSNEVDEQQILCRTLDRWNNIASGNKTQPAFNPEKFLVIWLVMSQGAPGLDPRVPPLLPNCPSNVLSTMLNGTLVARMLLWNWPDEKIDFDDVDTQHFFSKVEALGRSRYGHPTGKLGSQIGLRAHAMWLGFVALDALERRLQSDFPPRSLLDFNFQSSDIAKMLKEEILKTRFNGIGGEFKFDQQRGEVDMSIYIDQYRPDSRNLDYPYARVLKFDQQSAKLTPLKERIIFGTADGRPPPDRKKLVDAGQSNTLVVLLISLLSASLVLVVGVACTIAYKFHKRKTALMLFEKPAWLIDFSKLVLAVKMTGGSSLTTSSSFVGISLTTLATTASHDTILPMSGRRGRIVQLNAQQPQLLTMQHLPDHALQFSVDVHNHKLMSTLHNNLQHDNILQFAGYCFSTTFAGSTTTTPSPKIDQYLLWQHCEKSSLYELVHGTSLFFSLDSLLECAIVLDIANGMSFLHKSSFMRAHGALCPAACLIDKRFSVKIADYADYELSEVFGLKTLMKVEVDDLLSFGTAQELVPYMAPEVARAWLENKTKIKTPSADVYSYAIILYELITRCSAHDIHTFSSEQIFQRVAASGAADAEQQPQKSTFFRPELSLLPSSSSSSTATGRTTIKQLIEACWSESPDARPTFRDVVRRVQQISGSDGSSGSSSSSVTDQLLKRLEHYASDMESLVRERTEELVVEKRRSDALLEAMLPVEVAAELKRTGQVQPESFDSVSVYFSDIVGFTNLSASSTPIQVVNFLNALYTMFDARIDQYDAYKVETVGDAYMVVSGLPRPNGTLHAAEIAKLSLALLGDISTFRIPHRPNDKLELRIGLHTGPCVAGVVGTKMPRYCLFGDTVNTANRMESTGLPSKIHISDAFASALKEFAIFIAEPRGSIEIKGKGEMSTFWLCGIVA